MPKSDVDGDLSYRSGVSSPAAQICPLCSPYCRAHRFHGFAVSGSRLRLAQHTTTVNAALRHGNRVLTVLGAIMDTGP